MVSPAGIFSVVKCSAETPAVAGDGVRSGTRLPLKLSVGLSFKIKLPAIDRLVRELPAPTLSRSPSSKSMLPAMMRFPVLRSPGATCPLALTVTLVSLPVPLKAPPPSTYWSDCLERSVVADSQRPAANRRAAAVGVAAAEDQCSLAVDDQAQRAAAVDQRAGVDRRAASGNGNAQRTCPGGGVGDDADAAAVRLLTARSLPSRSNVARAAFPAHAPTVTGRADVPSTCAASCSVPPFTTTAGITLGWPVVLLNTTVPFSGDPPDVRKRDVL